ncbi:hypothetical protein VSS93_27585, partial [Pseudomonas syringae pv. tagetis]
MRYEVNPLVYPDDVWDLQDECGEIVGQRLAELVGGGGGVGVLLVCLVWCLLVFLGLWWCLFFLGWLLGLCVVWWCFFGEFVCWVVGACVCGCFWGVVVCVLVFVCVVWVVGVVLGWFGWWGCFCLGCVGGVWCGWCGGGFLLLCLCFWLWCLCFFCGLFLGVCVWWCGCGGLWWGGCWFLGCGGGVGWVLVCGGLCCCFGVGFGVFIFWWALLIARDSVSVLLDVELPAYVRSRMLALACEVPGVVGAHDLRTRISGNRCLV